jgi:sugar (pentulose or hexulose) kinase
MKTDALIVLDIGKTNAKLALIDAEGRLLAERRRASAVHSDGPYPHLDIEGLWDWMLAGCREFAALAPVSAIVPVTHGATAALVDAGLGWCCRCWTMRRRWTASTTTAYAHPLTRPVLRACRPA